MPAAPQARATADLSLGAGVLLAYLVTARLGLRLDAVSGFATLVWPPTGIALFALWRWGLRLWPAIAVGAGLANALAGAPVAVAAGIAAGNTLEAVVGVLLLRRAGFSPRLDRVRDVIALGAVALCAPVVSATIGSLSLLAGGVADASAAPLIWRSWWLGDVLGAWTVASLLWVWSEPPLRLTPRPQLFRRAAEAGALVAVSAALSGLVFGGLDVATAIALPHLVFPALIWAALRFGPRGVVTIIAEIAAIAIAGTAARHGPFVQATVSESLLLLQVFMGLSSAAAMILAASVAERDRHGARAENAEREVRAERDLLSKTEEAAVLLAEASAILSRSLDYERLLGELTHLMVPRLTDGCTIHLADEPRGGLHRVALACADPERQRHVEELMQKYPPDPAALTGAGNVLRTGAPELHAEISDQSLAAGARDQEHLTLLRRVGMTSAMVLPMTARGRTFGAITMISAGSARRFGEADLALARDLAQRAAYAVDNARLYDEARQAIRARDEFLSVASHELRTPLTSLELQVDSLRQAAEREVPLPPERYSAKLDIMSRQVDRLTALVESLVDVSRGMAGRLPLHYERLDLTDVVRDVAARFRAELNRAGCELVLALPPGCPGCWDRLRLEQVLSNLVSNALKYGGGRPVEIRLASEARQVALSVRDHGIGIADEDQGRIFERFERAVSQRHYGGLGLGLWIAKRALSAMGGTIEVVSQPGEGAEFNVVLPVSPPAAPDGESPGLD